ncbi:MAG: SDR family NAD(P)-dependent oxidoreductase [Chloroflexi bacterium]|nr:SDR family NAD(P)-dependent oxidoreductase [Chloroflexota bacterium]
MAEARLKDKVAIVSGAGTRGPMPGTGQATAILFARHGAKVLLTDLDLARAEETGASIAEEGGTASVFQADVTNEAACRAMIETCVARYGRLDILFNNVGGIGSGKVSEIEEAYLDRSLAVNLKGAILTCKHAIPAMTASGGGSIINVSSIDGLRAGWTPNVPYAVAKAGLAQLTRVTAVHHGRDNIRANCIAPGHLYAPFVGNISDERRELRRKAGPLGTEGDAWDVAWAALFLASDESRWISGVVLPVDGGLLAATPLAVYDNLH